MFNHDKGPHIFGLAPGVDFGQGLIEGLLARVKTMTPDALARVEIFVNTRRMQRRLRDLFDAGPAMLLPRIRLVTDLAGLPTAAGLPLPTPPLRRRLELAELVSRLLESQPDLAPRSALFALSDSLAALLEEMHGEGVSADAIEALDVSDQSGHWQRSLAFMTIVRTFSGEALGPSSEARQRAAVELLCKKWESRPPDHPVIVAGSTGSRGSTAMLMAAVANLPNGAVVLPGFDTEMPPDVWTKMADANGPEDHPQFRFVRLFQRLGVTRDDVRPWSEALPACPDRNRLVSLALRPAPVTDRWRIDGPGLGDLNPPTAGITLVEAADQRTEAAAIAHGIRSLIGGKRRVALITPDRQLSRQVTAELARWSLVPDDSAGQPLHLTPPGRLLRQVSALFGRPVTSEALLALIKHPLVSSGSDRGEHLRISHDLELWIRRKGVAFPSRKALEEFAVGEAPERWLAWIGPLLDQLDAIPIAPVGDHIARHTALSEALTLGPQGTGAPPLWAEAAGRKAREAMAELGRHADACIDLEGPDYANLVYSVLSAAEVRNPDVGHPLALIWGTLEARVQGADVTILGGLNEGVWPETPPADPWLNRRMRQDAGLLLPERRIGLSAHDFQQAVAGGEVWLTRSLFSGEAATIPSRWLNRIENLLTGLPDQNGPEALAAMRQRGQAWIGAATAAETPTALSPPATRPSPRPPIDARPKKLSVTQIKTLIRDPYAIYAKEVLGLRQLDSLTPEGDAPLKGIILHKVMERFVDEGVDPLSNDAVAKLIAIATQELNSKCPWPTIRHLWLSRFSAVADDIIAGERLRRGLAKPELIEKKTALAIPEADFTLSCRADRIDTSDDNEAFLYDYKSGGMPTKKQQQSFDLQLLLQAAMIERGAFDKIGKIRTARAEFVGIGANTACVAAPLDELPTDQIWDDFVGLLNKWRQKERGYTARLALFTENEAGYYDHLARFGEWDSTDDVVPEDLT